MQSPVSLKGESLIGTILNATDEQGRLQTFKIADVEVDPQDHDLYLYTVLRQNPDNSEWQNLCQPDSNGTAKAIPLAGQWDQAGNHLDNGQITFACTSGVLAKCLRLGYKPWQQINGESLRNYHQACTRMLRADYCGNGIAHTQEGTPIDVYDRLNIQQATSSSNMVFEAAWSPEGAVLLSRTRYPNTLKQLQQECPDKLNTILQLGDDITDAPQALLFNRSIERQ
ncbi:MAG: hypothetical protein Kow00121_12700 [Elainellaceae cyanobacterium]